MVPAFFVRDLAERMHERRLVGPRCAVRAGPSSFSKPAPLRNLTTFPGRDNGKQSGAGAGLAARRRLAWPPEPSGRKQPRRSPAGGSPTRLLPSRSPGENARARAPRQAVQGSSPTGHHHTLGWAWEWDIHHAGIQKEKGYGSNPTC